MITREIIEELIRDATKVGSIPKSEMRARILGIIESAKAERSEEILEMIEKAPLGLTRKLKIGVNNYALEMVRKTPGNEYATMEDIKEYNEKMKEWDKGYETAINKLKKWHSDCLSQVKALLSPNPKKA